MNESIYPNLVFPKISDRPFFYLNVVQTLDGKVQVAKNPKAYWPIGSDKDYETLIELRAAADVLIHGKGTATWTRALDKLGQSDFQVMRQKAGKSRDILYLVISAHPTDELIAYLNHPPVGVAALLVTVEDAAVSKKLAEAVEIVRLGKSEVDIALLSQFLYQKGYTSILVEGGPTLWASFFQCNLIDEIFVTIAPKIFGDEEGNTMTLISNHLFPPKKTPKLKLLSVQQYFDELYLRYRVK